jgi:methylated-DNA-[protein]-cysteine S-methyltransferase
MYYFSRETILGKITICAQENVVTGLYFGCPHFAEAENMESPMIRKAFTQLAEYLNGSRKVFHLEFVYGGSSFQMSVWDQLKKIPYGETRSYGEIATAIGKPGAAIAVGGACGKNPISIFIPCHRVVGSDGNLTGYGGGIHIKKQLLEMEKNI